MFSLSDLARMWAKAERESANYIEENRDGWFSTAPGDMEEDLRSKAHLLEAMADALDSKDARSSFGDIMDKRQREQEFHTLHMQNAGLKNLIRLAICAECSDQIMDEDFETNANDQLCHKRCITEEDE